MPQDEFNPKLGRMRDAGCTPQVRHTTRVFRQAGKAGARALRQKGHVAPSALKRGMGAGGRAAAGLIAPGSRRVIVKARYTRIVAVAQDVPEVGAGGAVLGLVGPTRVMWTLDRGRGLPGRG
jgi:hypothetical protein